MPELPEVEVVRRGLEAHVIGATIDALVVTHPRSVRRHVAGAQDLIAQLTGQTIVATGRRGKFLWLELAPSGQSLVVHLGMSGQMLIQPADSPLEKHAHIVAMLSSGPQLRFVDQRTFGGWSLAEMVEVDGTSVPEPVAHIARDPLDPKFNAHAVVTRMKTKDSEIKRVLLDQTVIAGIGNIYADESLWRAKLHGRRIASEITRPALHRLIGHAREVMMSALEVGGTSFDALYVNVNGQSGYFDRSLHAYGREGEPCDRCGAVMLRESFMNRSSFFCPRCQTRPRPTS